jgi:hypothetical protein
MAGPLDPRVPVSLARASLPGAGTVRKLESVLEVEASNGGDRWWAGSGGEQGEG